MTTPPGRKGMTLLEVIVALSISAMVVLVARELIASVAQASTRVELGRRAAAWRGNGDLLVRRLLASVPLVADSAPFAGSERVVSFRSSCLSPGGWTEPCSVMLATLRSDSGALLLSFSGSPEPVVLRSGFHHAAFRYLANASGGGRWTAHWTEPDELPLAVGILVDADTTIVPVGVIR